MNENCLEGVKCPSCGQQDKFSIAGTALFVDVTDDGTNMYEEVEWDEDSFTRCSACGFEGVLRDFRERRKDEEPQKMFEVAAYIKKRYTTVIRATSIADAVSKASDLVHVEGLDIESYWDEDPDYYDYDIADDAREVERETPSDP